MRAPNYFGDYPALDRSSILHYSASVTWGKSPPKIALPLSGNPLWRYNSSERGFRHGKLDDWRLDYLRSAHSCGWPSGPHPVGEGHESRPKLGTKFSDESEMELRAFNSIDPGRIEFLGASMGTSCEYLDATQNQAARSGGEITSPKLTPIQKVIGQTFDTQNVEADNKWFVDCTFKNVTLVWEGGFLQWQNSKFVGKTRLLTHNPTIIGSVDILKGLGFLEKGFAQDWRHLDGSSIR